MKNLGTIHIVRLKKDVSLSCEQFGEDFLIKSGSVGIAYFKPFYGFGVTFEGCPSGFMVNYHEIEDDLEKIFTDIKMNFSVVDEGAVFNIHEPVQTTED